MAKMTWYNLCDKLTSLSEAEISDLLEEEIKQHKRPAVARRLHQRLCILRAARERVEILQEIAK